MEFFHKLFNCPLPEPVTTKSSLSVRNERFLVGSTAMQGWRRTMEDSHIHLLNFCDEPNVSYFAVFDGHGGSQISHYASQYLHKFLHKRPEYKEGNIEEALRQAFLELDDHMLHSDQLESNTAGSTAIVILLKGDQLYCANLGDSRAIASVGGRVQALSVDHKPYNDDEKSRIVNAGGSVDFQRVNGILALSRALGDFPFKKNREKSVREQAIIAYPDVETRTINDDWEFLVLACDGIWDVLTNEDVVDFVRSRIADEMEPDKICEQLVSRCLSPDSLLRSIGCDNMTVIIVCFLRLKPYKELADKCKGRSDICGEGSLTSSHL